MITPRRQWTLAFAGVIAALAALAGACQLISVRAQAVLDQPHTPGPSLVHAASDPGAIARGAHLVTVTACASCHSGDLTGRALTVSGSEINAPNLTRLAPRLSDAALDRAIRGGLRPNGASELVMPSHVYAGFSDDEIAAIIAYLRQLPPRGAIASQRPLGLLLRINLLVGLFHTEVDKLARARPPLDAGAVPSLGRHLAAVACGQCHGPDLAGGHGAPGPDLTVHGYYSRAQFHTLMRTGVGVDDSDMDLMSSTARDSFSHFTDDEINALYDYLDARDRILDARQGR